MLQKLLPIILILSSLSILAQDHINDFISVKPLDSSTDFIIASSHSFQKIIEYKDTMSDGSIMKSNIDFTGFFPIDNSSKNGYLCINNELIPNGGTNILDITMDNDEGLWQVQASEALDFSAVGGTASNCSGTISPWKTMFSCEETISKKDKNEDGYNDNGWCVEIDPINKVVLGKKWALGCMNHENIAIHSNHRTVYEGADSEPGYLYKFVADEEQDLSAGKLFVYKGSKNGVGEWLEIKNTTKEERNTTIQQSKNKEATVFNGVEDVEIGPDGMIYFAVKMDGKVYRFRDSDPISGLTVPMMETFVGGKKYKIKYAGGAKNEPWGFGNDNLAFDGQGNLWVLQDGTRNFIWVVENGHTQSEPKVKIFGRIPIGSEPTGISFSPNYRYLFMAIQHPDTNNVSSVQLDAAGNQIAFDRDISLVIALNKYLGEPIVPTINITHLDLNISPNPSSGYFTIEMEHVAADISISILNILGEIILEKNKLVNNKLDLNLSRSTSGIYFVKVFAGNQVVDIRKIIIQ